ncbi:MAG: hypothetical protein E7407_02810 [Ruminococcaceae bacterium]|nr:hypothetical protein [Oscillospiraceae bacterium]
MKIKRFRKFICAVFVVCLMVSVLFSVTAFAAPETLPGDTYSTKPGLVFLRAPQYVVSTTTNERLAIAATAPQGTTVTVYRYDAASGLYNKAYLNDAPVEAVVGSTMLFAGQVDLVSGANKFIIRGEAVDGSATVVHFDVSLLSKDFMERIKSIIELNF